MFSELVKSVLWVRMCLLFVLAGCVPALDVFGQEYIIPAKSRSFTVAETKGYHEVWAVTTDTEGRVFVGTKNGVSVFNGEIWTLIETERATTIRSLDFGYDGRVYVGEQGDFGFLASDSLGRLSYSSLASGYLGAPDSDFADVWATHATKDAVYFQTSEAIYVWSGSSVRVLKSGSSIHTSFKVGGNIYVRERGIGISKVTAEGFEILPGTEFFAEMRIFVLHESLQGDWIVGTRDNGFYRYNPTDYSIISMKTDVDHVLSKHWLYGFEVLRPGVLVLNTLGAGILIMKEDGAIVAHYPNVDGLGDKYITKVYRSEPGTLWIGKRNSSVSVVRFPEAISKISEVHGLDGIVNSVDNLDDALAVSTNSGLYLIRMKAPYSKMSIAKADGIQNSWDSELSDGKVLVAHDDGISAVGLDGSGVDLIGRWGHGQVYQIEKDPLDSDLLWVGTKTGLVTVRLEKNQLRVEESKYLGFEVRQILFQADGMRLWAIGQRNSVAQVVLNSNRRTVATKQYSFSPEKAGDRLSGSLVDSELVISDGAGFYGFDSRYSKFKKYDLSSMERSSSKQREIL